MYWNYYNNLFWGFLLVLINIRFGGFNILPEFIGFIIIYNALNGLAQQHDYFYKARPFAGALILLSLPNLYETPEQNLLMYPITNQNLLMVLIGQAYIIIHILMVYYISRAISELAEEMALADLYHYNNSVWRFYLALSSAMLAAAPFMYTILAEFKGLLVILIILAFISLIFLQHLIHRAGQELGSHNS
ncbi:hypothetical protein [Candidatus Contubernalis alkaliaceticus]|uniref:hypothetical protein n=1 Tax=Candidatus Contubernalis alkaliaceticus TaxID=338645 RepID=UPI001F4C42AB|nr:hypothetical protein [Candidatus Contubernalis alkalaceticus]UNC92017.1 hypothetical protein HUE98_07845 [Candidatus Contubernalis alkalaceticus]